MVLPLVLMSLSVTDMASWADLSKVSRKFRGNVAVNEITRTARITDSFRDSLWAVSYTHLDVYKRQMVFTARSAMA